MAQHTLSTAENSLIVLSLLQAMRKYNFRSLCILDTLLWATEGRLVCWCVCVDNLPRGPTKTVRHAVLCRSYLSELPVGATCVLQNSRFTSVFFVSLLSFLFRLTFFVSAIFSLCSFLEKKRAERKNSRDKKKSTWHSTHLAQLRIV